MEVSVKVDGHPLNIEINTGAAVTLISESTYSGEALGVLGELEVETPLGQQQEKLPFLVIKGERDSLLGRNWLVSIKLDW